MAKELDALRDLHLQKEQAEHVSGLSALLAFNEGMAASLKDVLKNRDHALGQYNKATALLDSRSKEAQKWQLAQQASGGTPRAEAVESGGSGSGGVMGSLMRKFVDDPNKGAKLQSKVSEAERALEETKAKWDTISESLAQEAAEFHAITNADFANGLRGAPPPPRTAAAHPLLRSARHCTAPHPPHRTAPHRIARRRPPPPATARCPLCPPPPAVGTRYTTLRPRSSRRVSRHRAMPRPPLSRASCGRYLVCPCVPVCARAQAEHAMRQIAFEEEQQRKWNALLAVFEQVPSSAV